jgi:hypothetical protein
MNTDYELYDPTNPEHNNSELYEVVEYDENIGAKNTYSCYIDSDGSPQLQPFGSIETDEPNGLEVTFPVKTDDFQNFRKEAENVFRPFLVHPEIKGNNQYSKKEFNILTESNDWQLVETTSEYRWNRETIRVAVQGNIEYPLDISILRHKLSQKAKTIVDEDYRLFFEIGELDIAASREGLGYDDMTINNIVAKIEKMADEIEEIHNKHIQSFETAYEARKYIRKLHSQSSIYNDFKFFYNDEEIDSSVELSSDDEIVKYFQKRRGYVSRDELKNTYSTRKFNISLTNTIFVLNDNNKKTRAISKARSLVQNDTIVYLVQDIKTIIKLGNPEYIKASDIELEKTSVSSKTSGSFFKKYIDIAYSGSQWNYSYDTAENINLDLSKKFFYVRLNGGSPSDSVYSLNIVAKYLNLIPEGTCIYGVQTRHTTTAKFKAYKGVDFVEYVIKKLKSKNTFKKSFSILRDDFIYRSIDNMYSSYSRLLENTEFIRKLRDISPDNLFIKISEDYERTSKQKNNITANLNNIAANYNIELPSFEYNEVEEVISKYPMIKEVGWCPGTQNSLDYIQGQDLLLAFREQQEQQQQNNTEEEAA